MNKPQRASPVDRISASTALRASTSAATDEPRLAQRTEENRIGEPFHRFQELKGTDFAAAVRCFSQFKTGLLGRMEWEDAHLFPAYSERAGGDVDNTCAAMRLEHEQIRALLNTIELKLIQSNSATEQEERALEAALVAHNHREHRIVYSALEH